MTSTKVILSSIEVSVDVAKEHTLFSKVVVTVVTKHEAGGVATTKETILSCVMVDVAVKHTLFSNVVVIVEIKQDGGGVTTITETTLPVMVVVEISHSEFSVVIVMVDGKVEETLLE